VTLTATPPGAAAPPGPAATSTPPPRRRRSRRWIRLAAPFAVLLILWTITAAAHIYEEPDLDEPGTLSPTGTGPDGSSRLAELLRARGVLVDHVTSSQQAIGVAATGDSTIFVPAPDFLNPTFAAFIASVDGAHRVVVVRPGRRTTFFSPVPIYPANQRWATAVVEPACSEAFAVAAGPAAAHRQVYAAERPAVDCYFGGVVGIQVGDTEIIYVGASDPFRNGRIGESGNAALATGLLAEHGRVVWLDVHSREPVSVSPGDRPNFQIPEYRRGNQDRTNTGFPTIDAFPRALWAVIVVGFAAAVLLALARARRLGPPVSEPLPVLVPAAEAVTGRGRLYRRIDARDATLAALRGAAVSRIARVLNPFGGTGFDRDLTGQRDLLGQGKLELSSTVESFIDQVAARTGTPATTVWAILYGSPPKDDEGLAGAVADLDRLVAAVLRDSAFATSAASGVAQRPDQGTPHRQGWVGASDAAQRPSPGDRNGGGAQ
jgi:hypothetical protein